MKQTIFKLSMLLLLSSWQQASAEENTKAVASEHKNTKPSMAFLLYLAELEEVDGELVGPMDIAEAEKLANNPENTTMKDENLTNKQPQPETKIDE